MACVIAVSRAASLTRGRFSGSERTMIWTRASFDSDIWTSDSTLTPLSASVRMVWMR